MAKASQLLDRVEDAFEAYLPVLGDSFVAFFGARLRESSSSLSFLTSTLSSGPPAKLLETLNLSLVYPGWSIDMRHDTRLRELELTSPSTCRLLPKIIAPRLCEQLKFIHALFRVCIRLHSLHCTAGYLKKRGLRRDNQGLPSRCCCCTGSGAGGIDLDTRHSTPGKYHTCTCACHTFRIFTATYGYTTSIAGDEFITMKLTSETCMVSTTTSGKNSCAM